MSWPFSRTRSERTSAADGAVAHSSLPAWAASALLHAALLVLLALSWRPAVRSADARAGEPERAGQIALVSMRRGTPDYLIDAHGTADDAQATSPAAADTPPLESPLPGPAAVASSADAMLRDVSELATDRASSQRGLPDASELIESRAPSGAVGGKATTGVFGVEGTGTRFVYVFDRSASMGDLGGRPMRAAQQQLLASLAQLGRTHQFQIVFYNEAPQVFNPNAPQPPRLLFADAQMQRLAERFVRGMIAAGGTQHWDALRLALDMRPDVIFLLTDGTENPITPGQLAQIRRQNQRQGTQIQTIEFGSGPQASSYNFLVQLAEQNHGQYAYVDVTRLVP